jgi:hypothetical protein
MQQPADATRRQSPSLIVGPDGEPTAVIIDLETWRSIVQQLEDRDDIEAIRAVSADLDAFRCGRTPEGWLSWEDFEAELDGLESHGELPR